MNPKPGWIFALLPRFDKTARRRGRRRNPGTPNGGRGGLIWAIFAGVWTHSSLRLLLNARPSNTSCRCRRRLRPEFGNEPQNLLEHLPWDGDLGHLECDVAAVADDLRTDLDQFLLQARYLTVLYLLRRSPTW